MCSLLHYELMHLLKSQVEQVLPRWSPDFDRRPPWGSVRMLR